MKESVISWAKKIRKDSSTNFSSFFKSKEISIKFEIDSSIEKISINELITAFFNTQHPADLPLTVDFIQQQLINYQAIQKQLSIEEEQLEKLDKEEAQLTKHIEKITDTDLFKVINEITSLEAGFELKNAKQQEIIKAKLVLQRAKQLEIEEKIKKFEIKKALKRQEVLTQNTKLNEHRGNYAAQIKESEQLIKEIQALEKLLDSAYHQAISQDEQLSEALSQSVLFLGVAAGLGGLALTSYFLPALIAGSVAVLVGCIPAALFLIIMILVLIAGAASAGSADGLGKLLEALFVIGFYCGLQTYPLVYVAAPFIAAASAIAAVAMLGVSAFNAIKAAILNHSNDYYFEQTFIKALLKENNDEVVEKLSLEERPANLTYSFFNSGNSTSLPIDDVTDITNLAVSAG